MDNIYEAALYKRIMNKISKALKFSLNDIIETDDPGTLVYDILPDVNVGDIIYKDDEPYIICVSDGSDFKDRKPRFMSIFNQKTNMPWLLNQSYTINKVTHKKYKKNSFPIEFHSMYHIDQYGYNNTKKIINSEYINVLPAYKYCISCGDTYYLPSIDELECVYLNKDILNEKLEELKAPLILDEPYWSSTEYSNNNVLYIHMSYNYIRLFDKRKGGYVVRPFVKYI